MSATWSHSDELLGSILAFPKTWDEYQRHLKPELFKDLLWLWDIMLQTSEEEGFSYRGVVNRTPAEHLQTVASLRNIAYSEERIPFLIKRAKQEHLSMKLKNAAFKISNSLTEGDDVDEVLRLAKKEIDPLANTDLEDDSDISDDLDQFTAHVLQIYDNPELAYGMRTGLPEIDSLTMGWQRGDFSVIGARTSMGKSAFMIENVLRLHIAGYKVGVYSLEMSKTQIFYRMMANLCQANLKMFRTGRLDKSFYDLMLQKKSLLVGLHIDDRRGVDSEYIADSMRRRKRDFGLDFVVVDYLQDVKQKGEVNDNQGSALGRVCRKLRAAAKEFDCHVMGLSQVSRSVEERTDKRPGNSDLSGSTGIETSADVIALLYRDDYYNPDSEKKGILEVNFTKQRNGEVGRAELYYQRETQRISSVIR